MKEQKDYFLDAISRILPLLSEVHKDKPRKSGTIIVDGKSGTIVDFNLNRKKMAEGSLKITKKS